MPTFQDAENKPPAKLFKNGDYKWTCVGFEIGIVASGSDSGRPEYAIELHVDGPDATVWDRMRDTVKGAWRIDTFLKCGGVSLQKGESFEFRQDEANQLGVKWVNPIGLRGWGYFEQDSYVKPGTTTPKVTMKCKTFYTDKEKLPPDEKLREAANREAEEQAAADEFKPF